VAAFSADGLYTSPVMTAKIIPQKLIKLNQHEVKKTLKLRDILEG
jgi:hypothetical protein